MRIYNIKKRLLKILKENFNYLPVRKITVAVSNLESLDDNVQFDLFTIQNEKERYNINKRKEEANKIVDDMQNKFGISKISFGKLINNDKNT